MFTVMPANGARVERERSAQIGDWTILPTVGEGDGGGCRTGKVTTAETGRIVFEEGGHWSTDSDVLVIQWLNVNVGSFDFFRVFSHCIT